MGKRLKAWEASKEVGKGLKSGLVNLRDLRNKTVQGLGYNDYFEYQVSDYGMSSKEMIENVFKNSIKNFIHCSENYILMHVMN